MKAYEFPSKVAQDGRSEVPESSVSTLPAEQPVRVILLIEEPEDAEERAWRKMSAEPFLAGYAEADDIYNAL